ncbi:MAG: dihydropteroate synthase [Actinomycetes bacterium]
MGVVNVTPDSFSDGGRWFTPTEGIEHGLRLLDEGADLVDVGGESTRPGAERVPVEEERRRVLPVVRALSRAGAAVSVDTMRAQVAEEACEAGAVMVNDVSGGLADPGMLAWLAASGVPCVLMHWRGHSADMASRARYTDIVTEVRDELAARLTAARYAGVMTDRIVLDPGLGFAKGPEHNWALLAHLEVLIALGRPLLIGASRKAFLGRLLADAEGEARAVEDRDDATAATSALAAAVGAWGVRVHAVRPSSDAVRVAAAVGAAR